jgi:hypothetical protein
MKLSAFQITRLRVSSASRQSSNQVEVGGSIRWCDPRGERVSERIRSVRGASEVNQRRQFQRRPPRRDIVRLAQRESGTQRTSCICTRRSVGQTSGVDMQRRSTRARYRCTPARAGKANPPTPRTGGAHRMFTLLRSTSFPKCRQM